MKLTGLQPREFPTPCEKAPALDQCWVLGMLIEEGISSPAFKDGAVLSGCSFQFLWMQPLGSGCTQGAGCMSIATSIWHP